MFWKKWQAWYTFQSQYKLLHISMTPRKSQKRITIWGCNKSYKSYFSRRISRVRHVLSRRKAEEATACLWSLLNWVLVQWCHADLTGMPCFCLNKQPCFFSGIPESDPRQEPKDDIVMSVMVSKHHHRQNIACSQKVFFFCLFREAYTVDFSFHCQHTVSVEIKVCQHLHSVILFHYLQAVSRCC